MDVGIGFVDRVAVVVAVSFSKDLWVLHISICITPETISTFDPRAYAPTIRKFLATEITRSRSYLLEEMGRMLSIWVDDQT
jgi:hypothetical protein